MTKSFDELKKFAISDILSVSGKDKATRVIENHMNNLIEVALIVGAQSKQAKIDELQHKVKCEREISLFADKLCVDLQSQVDELRKRIDETLHLIKITYGNCHTESIKQILEGTTNEQ